MSITYHYTSLTHEDLKAILIQQNANHGLRPLSEDALDQAVDDLMSRYLIKYYESSSIEQHSILFQVLTCPPEDCLLYINLDKHAYDLSSLIVSYRLERGI